MGSEGLTEKEMQEIATLEAVRHSVDKYEAEGKQYDAAMIIRDIGGGSKTTVYRHLRAIAQERAETQRVQNAAPPAPTTVTTRLEAIWPLAYAEAAAIAGREVSRLQEEMGKISKEKDDLLDDNVKFLEHIKNLDSEAEDLRKTEQELRQDLAAAASQEKAERQRATEMDEAARRAATAREQALANEATRAAEAAAAELRADAAERRAADLEPEVRVARPLAGRLETAEARLSDARERIRSLESHLAEAREAVTAAGRQAATAEATRAAVEKTLEHERKSSAKELARLQDLIDRALGIADREGLSAAISHLEEKNRPRNSATTRSPKESKQAAET